jgi:hypothetical protein
LPEQPAQAGLAWSALLATKHLGEFVSVLVSRDCEKT